MKLITNANIITATQQFPGTLMFDNDIIRDVAPGATSVAADNWEGDYLLPGMVELHTDNLEKHLMPRPKTKWPVLPAIVAHDAQVAAAGITTVLDALSAGDIDSADSTRNEILMPCAEGLRIAQAGDALRADHFLHLRLELAEEKLIDMFAPFIHDERLKLVSLMDHTPGQRQWTDISHYRVYVGGKRGWSEEKIDAMLEVLLQRQQVYVAANRREVIRLCRESAQPVPLATHDDTTVDHVEEGIAEGVTISEFPTTVLAAQAARERGMGIIMGAPNVVRGGSHSGNVSAAELARAGLLDALSSDYVPSSLLHAAFLLQKEGFTLSQAMNTVSRNPARMIDLYDRGEIATGLRADFLRVRMVGGIPVVLETWKAGRRIA
jgi:alpha-D-ribose 1-methylphosphonate 5-triphosphate diphosphatase